MGTTIRRVPAADASGKSRPRKIEFEKPWAHAGLPKRSPEWTEPPRQKRSTITHASRPTSSQSEPEAEPEIIRVGDMPDSVLSGRLGEIFDQRLRKHGIPVSYGYVALLVAAGSLVPQAHPVRTNLYGVLAGGVHSGKSTACEWAMDVMGIGPPIRLNVMTGSSEGLMEELEGSGGEARLVYPGELGHLLEKARIDRSSFPYVLNEAFYKNEMSFRVASRKKIIFNCSLSLLGGIVEAKFDSLFGSATTGGLYDRCLFGRCPEPFAFSWRPFEGGTESIKPVAVELAGDCFDVRDTWTKMPGGNSRVAEICMRVAKINASFDGRSVLHGKDPEMVAAASLYQQQLSARMVLRPNPGENPDACCSYAIRANLERFAPNHAWMARRELYKRIHGERFGPGVFQRALQNLASNGDVEIEISPKRLRLL